MSLRPLNDWVLVDIDPAPGEASVGGIVLAHPPLVRKGTVRSVGPGRLFVDGVYRGTELKEGDRVAFLAAVLDTKQGHTLKHALDENQVLIRESDVLFLIEEGDPELSK